MYKLKALLRNKLQLKGIIVKRNKNLIEKRQICLITFLRTLKTNKIMKMKDNEKVLIIGAGPIGCYCGYLLAKKGFDVEIYEEHKEIGKPIGCTGIVTKKIKKYIKLKNLK